jgi:hypothetical protein
MIDTRSSDPALSRLIAKLEELRARRSEANGRLVALTAEVREIDSEFQKCAEVVRSVAQVLGISLPDLPFHGEDVKPINVQDVSSETLKEWMEDAFKEAHSHGEPLRLKELRKLAPAGTDNKLVRDTLYRLARAGVIRNRDGWDWEYVPPQERNKQPSPSEE